MTTAGNKDVEDKKPGDNAAVAPARPRLTFDLDVDVCVVGGGLAGLTVAREMARSGASVAVLEGRQVGWNASGHTLGTVMPGFGHPIADLIARVGFEDARELWALAQEGADYIRAAVADMPGIGFSEGALEVSTVDSGDELISRLQTLGEDFGTDVEGWQAERVREVLRTPRYFHAIHYPKAFQIDGRRYVHGLAALAEQAGVRIFEDTPVVGLDPAGIRKRIATPQAKLRASHVVLAGGVHLGAPLQRLSDTLLPVQRWAAVTEPLGERLADVIAFQGSVSDTGGLAHYRIVEGDRLMWSGPETTWTTGPEAKPQRVGRTIARQIQALYPQLGQVAISEVFGGVFGRTVHGMPQVGEWRRGVWVASGFGRQGLNTSAAAGQLIAGGILHGDDRWRLFSPFELVWAGGHLGKIAGQAVITWSRGRATAAGILARYREGARARARAQEARAIAARDARTARLAGRRPDSPEGSAPQSITDVTTP
ncbi:FAD-binding oxidoreductase [Bradyrhizobium prioriisuperbiae]|uniref:NAD(P)/FAD-dependent oxidoreductase n=1 Tax=Bradyrhizobium prioriisuperbiae TaxID=2854389 RepID=UPI0028EB351A|nr:FAD-binding oxidoreductase [Bradyrhizobium prioritasuperba]